MKNAKYISGILYGILCDKEKEDVKWERSLENLTLELYAQNEKNTDRIIEKILIKLSVLKMLNHEYFRKTIFDCIGLCNRNEK